MARKIRVRNMSTLSIILTVVLSAICIACFAYGHSQFMKLKNITEDYILCEDTAQELQDGSRYLTDKVRLAALTGDQRYIDQYFTEINTYQRRDRAVKTLEENFADSDSLTALKAAMSESSKLCVTEYYAMKLVEEANGALSSEQPPEIRHVQLSKKDKALNAEDKMARARDLVSNNAYEEARTIIDSDLDKCVNVLVSDVQDGQSKAANVFEAIYLRLEVCVAVFIVMMILTGVMLRYLVVAPLRSYNESIQRGEIFPVVGAWELQNLAETYNRVYRENEETQALIKHQAEHDALTDLLNRGVFDKMLDVYEKNQEESPFALILCDVDQFKGVNDNCGHANGDKILKRVASLLKTTFRSIDHVCRIGGDEFAVIMVEMTSDLEYTISEKIDFINEQLAELNEEGFPEVSISAGIAFTDRPNPGKSLFTDADDALYYTKEHGRHGYTFYGKF